LERYKEVFAVIEKAVYLILDDNICNTKAVILCNLGKIKENQSLLSEISKNKSYFNRVIN
jgi:hypothetical protein